jgi:hypothetical protein
MRGLGTLINTKEGQIIVSVLLGFGLATLFRKACKDQSCIVIKGPKMTEINGVFYRVGDTCYQYTPQITSCDKKM